MVTIPLQSQSLLIIQRTISFYLVIRTAPTVQNYGTQTSGLSAGDYLITVTDSKGCTDTETILLQTTPITFVEQ
jgi:hypothetical protein